MKRFTILSFVAALFFLVVVGFGGKRSLSPSKLPNEKETKRFTPFLTVNDSARFHPLLREPSKNELSSARLAALKAYLVVNADSGEVYSARNVNEKIPPASLTKLVTAMVALDIATSSAKLTASQKAASQEPTILGVKPGETFTLEELIKAMIATSGNDAATIVGEETLRPFSGNEEVFVSLMNKKAELLGLGNTNFTNTQGFDDENQYTNAYDLARIARYAYKNYLPIRTAAASRYAALEETERHGFYHLPNWNALLTTYPGVDGLKIGFTEKAGHLTIVTATRKYISLIVIVVGAGSIVERDLAAAALLNYGFQKEGIKGVKVDESLIKPRLDEWRELREQILQELYRESKIATESQNVKP